MKAFFSLALALCAQDPTPPRAPATWALFVGVEEYPELRKSFGAREYAAKIALDGPANDVALMRGVLERRFGATAERTRELVGWPDDAKARPTRANVLAELERLARDAGERDRVVVYFAGHGTQQPAARGVSLDEPDGLDEVLLPADVARFDKGRGSIPGAITDDELGAAITKIRAKGAFVWAIVDACHSGTVLRGGDASVRLRGLDPELLDVPSGARASSGERQASWTDANESDGVVLFFGAQSFGRAPEMKLPVDGRETPHGLFTYLLAEQLERSDASASFRELAERVIAAYRAFPCQITLPGALGALDTTLGGAFESLDHRLTLGAGPEGRYVANRGALAGLTADTVIAVVSESSSAPVCELVVKSTTAVEALCEPRTQRRPPGFGPWTARVVSRPIAARGMSLALVDAERRPLARDEAPQPWRDVLAARAAMLTLLDDAAAADWIAVSDGAHSYLHARAREGGLDVAAPTAQSLERALRSIVKVRNLRGLVRDGVVRPLAASDLDVALEVRRAGTQRVDRVSSGATLHPLDSIRVRITHRAPHAFDLFVFYVDANYGVSTLFPTAGGSARLTPSVALPPSPWMSIVDTTLGAEQLLVLALPREAEEPVADLSFLAGRSLEQPRGGGSELTRVLFELAAGEATRGGLALDADELRGKLETFVVAWPELGEPRWPHGAPAALDVALASPLPAELGFAAPPLDRAWLARTDASAQRCDLAYAGDEASPRLALLDLDPAGSSAAELARGAEVVLAYDGARRIACYATERDGLSLCLVDLDGDDVADERWSRVDAAWRRHAPVAQPLVSQSYLAARLRGSVAESVLAARFAALRDVTRAAACGR